MTTPKTDDDNNSNNNALAHSIASSWAATNVDFSSPNDAAIEELKNLWNQVVAPLCSDSVNDDDWWTRLVELHSEPHRAYHTLVHLKECISLLKVHKQSHNPIMVLSVLFHDAIYDPKSGTNEEDSAKLFQEFSQEVHLQDDKNLIKTVHRYILATKLHKVQENNEEELALFLDIDMAVLGKQQTAYLHYAGLIRDEYNFVDRSVYCEKRAEILEQFLKAPKLYGSNAMSLALEQRARDNLAQEICLLKAGVIPGEK